MKTIPIRLLRWRIQRNDIYLVFVFVVSILLSWQKVEVVVVLVDAVQWNENGFSDCQDHVYDSSFNITTRSISSSSSSSISSSSSSSSTHRFAKDNDLENWFEKEQEEDEEGYFQHSGSEDSSESSSASWKKGIFLSILANLIGGASKLAIRKSWILQKEQEEQEQREEEEQQQQEEEEQQQQPQQHNQQTGQQEEECVTIDQSQRYSDKISHPYNSNCMDNNAYLQQPMNCRNNQSKRLILNHGNHGNQVNRVNALNEEEDEIDFDDDDGTNSMDGILQYDRLSLPNLISNTKGKTSIVSVNNSVRTIDERNQNRQLSQATTLSAMVVTGHVPTNQYRNNHRHNERSSLNTIDFEPNCITVPYLQMPDNDDDMIENDTTENVLVANAVGRFNQSHNSDSIHSHWNVTNGICSCYYCSCSYPVFLRSLGMIGMTVFNPLCGVLAMQYISPSIAAPFSGMTMVWILLGSGPLLNEYPTFVQLQAAALIVLGEVTVALFGDHTDGTNHDNGKDNHDDNERYYTIIQDVYHSYLKLSFILFFVGMFSWMMFLTYWMTKPQQQQQPASSSSLSRTSSLSLTIPTPPASMFQRTNEEGRISTIVIDHGDDDIINHTECFESNNNNRDNEVNRNYIYDGPNTTTGSTNPSSQQLVWCRSWYSCCCCYWCNHLRYCHWHEWKISSATMKRFCWGMAGGSVTGMLNFLKDALVVANAIQSLSNHRNDDNTNNSTNEVLVLRGWWFFVTILLLLAISVALGGLLLLSSCMKLYDVTYSSAMFIGSYVISASIMSMVHYDTFQHLGNNMINYIMYPSGLLILLGGISLLVWESNITATTTTTTVSSEI